MASKPRKDIVREGEIGIYHTWSRCVRRAFLMGEDVVSGINYEYRRGCLKKLIQYQCQVFAVDLGGYSIRSNHFHALGRTRPDITLGWDDEEVAWRWKSAWPKWDGNDWAREPNDYAVDELLNDKVKLAKVRANLASLSWWMARIKEPVAKLFNQEDEVKGHFFEQRFGCREILDEAAVLCCSAYVDLNAIVAGAATSLATSDYSSIQDRVVAAQAREAAASLEKFHGEKGRLQGEEFELELSHVQAMLADSFLAPIDTSGPLILPANHVAQPAAPLQLDSPSEPETPQPEVDQAAEPSVEPSATKDKHLSKVIHQRQMKKRRDRPSDNLFLNMELDQYRTLLEHLGRRSLIDQGKLTEDKSEMDPDLENSLRKMGIVPERFEDAVLLFNQLFGCVVGRESNVQELLDRSDRQRVGGQKNCRSHFT